MCVWVYPFHIHFVLRMEDLRHIVFLQICFLVCFSEKNWKGFISWWNVLCVQQIVKHQETTVSTEDLKTFSFSLHFCWDALCCSSELCCLSECCFAAGNVQCFAAVLLKQWVNPTSRNVLQLLSNDCNPYLFIVLHICLKMNRKVWSVIKSSSLNR